MNTRPRGRSQSTSAFRRGRARVLLAAICVLLIAGIQPFHPATAQDTTTVHWRAGWNLLAVPSGTLLDKASGPAYAFGPASDTYQVVAQGDYIGGRALWVFFSDDVTLALGRTAADFSRVLVPPDTYVLAGDPSSTDSVPISGADLAYVYDPVDGFALAKELKPGQGAFLLAHNGGAILLGKAPAGANSEELARLQQDLTQHPEDLTNLDRLATAGGDLVRQQQFARVQSTLDDLRAAFEDGLRLQGSEALPPQSKVQREAQVAVREALAQAASATAVGDLAKADASLERARKAAQLAADDGASLARSSTAVYAGRPVGQRGPHNLARYGAYVRAVFLQVGLGTPLTGAQQQLARDLLAGTGLAPVASPTPTLTPAAAAPACLTGNCRLTGTGGATVQLGDRYGGATVTATETLTFQVRIANGQVSGSGQYTTQFSFDGGTGCMVPPQQGTFTIRGTANGLFLQLSFIGDPPDIATVTCVGRAVGQVYVFRGQGPDPLFSALSIEARAGATASANLTEQKQGEGYKPRAPFTVSISGEQPG